MAGYHEGCRDRRRRVGERRSGREIEELSTVVSRLVPRVCKILAPLRLVEWIALALVQFRINPPMPIEASGINKVM